MSVVFYILNMMEQLEDMKVSVLKQLFGLKADAPHMEEMQKSIAIKLIK